MTVQGHYPESVRVFFDGRKLTAEQQNVVELTTRRIGVTLQTLFRRYGVRYSHAPGFRGLATHFLPGERIAVEWEHQPGFGGPSGAMYLVDSLASGILKVVKRDKSRRNMFAALAEAGYNFIDGTELIDGVPNAELVAHWERRSGLIMPR